MASQLRKEFSCIKHFSGFHEQNSIVSVYVIVHENMLLSLVMLQALKDMTINYTTRKEITNKFTGRCRLIEVMFCSNINILETTY